MATLEQLTSQARRHEERGDRSGALHLYQRAIRQMEQADEREPAARLYLRVADLHHEEGEVEEALDFYEKAGGQYTEQGLLNNAVAVWKKIARLYPEILDSHWMLAELYLDLDLQLEARQSMRTFVEHLLDEGDREHAEEAVATFLERTEDPEIAGLIEEIEDPDGAPASQTSG